MNTALVLLGAAAGATLRYLIDRRVQRWHDSPFPWGTLAVNVLGSLVLGFLTGAAMFGVGSGVGSGGGAGIGSGGVHAFVGVGLCGALTTFSTFGYETIALSRKVPGCTPWPMWWSACSPGWAGAGRGLGAAASGLLAAAAIWA